MAQSRYRTAPDSRSTMPTGIPHIIGNEAAERFSFYGMKGILAIFLAEYLHLMGSEPGPAMTQAAANENVHLFNTAVYATPFLGAILADAFFGKYRIIVWLSVVYCMGHAALALMGASGEARWWLFGGLALISLGSGGIKPCVSAHVGDQFGVNNRHLLSHVFSFFYFSINLGAFISMLLTPWLLKWHGPHLAFGVPGVLMALATLVFWMGRNRFVHIPPGGGGFLKEALSREGLIALLKLGGLFLFVAMFWSLFDQTGSSWIFQARDMDLRLFGMEWLPSQVQSINSLFVLAFIPLFSLWLYPAVSRVWEFTPLRKIGVGLGLMVLAFILSSLIQEWIEAGERPSIAWQVLAYALLTASEVLVSITALEFAYTQAPRKMKSLIMSLYLFSVAIGNFFTAQVNHFIQIPVPDLSETREASASVEPVLAEATMILEQLAVEAVGVLPKSGVGVTALAGKTDPWGNPLRYALLNSDTARISSDGPDAKPRTRWDLGVILTRRQAGAEKESATWLARRKRELGMDEPAAATGDASGLFRQEFYAGGQSRLEGSAYFWFFTWVMVGTTLVYVVMTRFYTPREYYHEEEETPS